MKKEIFHSCPFKKGFHFIKLTTSKKYERNDYRQDLVSNQKGI